MLESLLSLDSEKWPDHLRQLFAKIQDAIDDRRDPSAPYHIKAIRVINAILSSRVILGKNPWYLPAYKAFLEEVVEWEAEIVAGFLLAAGVDKASVAYLIAPESIYNLKKGQHIITNVQMNQINKLARTARRQRLCTIIEEHMVRRNITEHFTHEGRSFVQGIRFPQSPAVDADIVLYALCQEIFDGSDGSDALVEPVKLSNELLLHMYAKDLDESEWSDRAKRELLKSTEQEEVWAEWNEVGRAVRIGLTNVGASNLQEVVELCYDQSLKAVIDLASEFRDATLEEGLIRSVSAPQSKTPLFCKWDFVEWDEYKRERANNTISTRGIGIILDDPVWVEDNLSDALAGWTYQIHPIESRPTFEAVQGGRFTFLDAAEPVSVSEKLLRIFDPCCQGDWAIYDGCEQGEGCAFECDYFDLVEQLKALHENDLDDPAEELPQKRLQIKSGLSFKSPETPKRYRLKGKLTQSLPEAEELPKRYGLKGKLTQSLPEAEEPPKRYGLKGKLTQSLPEAGELPKKLTLRPTEESQHQPRMALPPSEEQNHDQ